MRVEDHSRFAVLVGGIPIPPTAIEEAKKALRVAEDFFSDPRGINKPEGEE
jgi:hypothetical protein